MSYYSLINVLIKHIRGRILDLLNRAIDCGVVEVNVVQLPNSKLINVTFPEITIDCPTLPLIYENSCVPGAVSIGFRSYEISDGLWVHDELVQCFRDLEALKFIEANASVRFMTCGSFVDYIIMNIIAAEKTDGKRTSRKAPEGVRISR